MRGGKLWRIHRVAIYHVVGLLSFLFLTPHSSASAASVHDDKRNNGSGGRLVANLFHRKPTTTPHDTDAGMIIQDHDAQQRRSTFPLDVSSNCSHSNHYYQAKRQFRRWWRPLIKKEQRQLARKAYRMAILASLAYHDFRDEPMHHDANNSHRNSTRNGKGNNSNRTWAFSLVDDPPPAQYLIGGRLADDGKKKLFSRSKRKIRNRTAQHLLSGVGARVQVSICRLQYEFDFRLRQRRHRRASAMEHSKTLAFNNSNQQRSNGTKIIDQCKHNVLTKHEGGKRYHIKYVLTDWHEEQAKIRWHDTDLIIATSGSSELVIAFAGTASPADTVTNIQTLEPISHSGLFNRVDVKEEEVGARSSRNANVTTQPSSLEGNIHRGYLNAYARVIRGKIRKLDNDDVSRSSSILTMTVDEYFNTCIMQQQRRRQQHTSEHSSTGLVTTTKNRDIQHNVTKKKIVDKHSKRRSKTKQTDDTTTCHSTGYRLLDLLRNITTTALQSGHTVHVVGHSLAGALAAIHALDIAMNHISTPIQHFHLWTYGAPEVADSLFFESAGAYSFRMRDFFSDASRYHRYVTQSEMNCEVTDVIASIASKSLNRRAVRRLGGVRGNVIHTIEPLYLPVNGASNGMELHELRNYLSGISTTISSSEYHHDGALSTDFPIQMKSWLGEST